MIVKNTVMAGRTEEVEALERNWKKRENCMIDCLGRNGMRDQSRIFLGV